MNDMSVIPAFAGTRPYMVSSDDYIRLTDAGAFGDAHVELVDGVLVEMAAAHTEHGRMLMHLGRLLGNVYEETDFVLYGDIITLFDENNIRAPDIAVVDRDIEGRRQLEPADILLAVEIAGSTLSFDLGRKRVDYASAGIRNYWVVDLEGRRVHTFADPLGADYGALRIVPFGEPIAVPGANGAVTVS